MVLFGNENHPSGIGKRKSTYTMVDVPSGQITCTMVKSRYIGDGHPSFNDGILIMGI